MSKEPLLPCPHCGAEARLTEHEPHDHSPELVAITGIPARHPGSWSIECVACSCGMIHDNRADAVAAWNRRAPQPAPVAVGAMSDERMPEKMWVRHGSAGNEWWSHHGYTAHKFGERWSLRLRGETLFTHEYLQSVMRHAENLIGDALARAAVQGSEPWAGWKFEDMGDSWQITGPAGEYAFVTDRDNSPVTHRILARVVAIAARQAGEGKWPINQTNNGDTQ